jgi:hypothetical protein
MFDRAIALAEQIIAANWGTVERVVRALRKSDYLDAYTTARLLCVALSRDADDRQPLPVTTPRADILRM